MISISFLIFVAVTLGIGACYLVVAELFFGDFTLVRQRLDAEFRRTEGEAPRSPLFKNLDPNQLDAPPPSVSYEMGRAEDTVSATPSTPPAMGLRERLEMMIEQANLKI